AGLNQAFIQIVSSLQRRSPEMVLRDLRKEIEVGRRSVTVERDAALGRGAEDRGVNAFGRFALNLQSASEGLYKLRESAGLLESFFENSLNPSKISLHTESLSGL